MKQILFVLTSFRHGGTNKSLENLLSLIDTDNYQVDVFAMEHYGPYKDMLPNCTILPEDKWLSALIAHWGDTKGLAKVRSLAVKLWRNIAGYVNLKPADYLYKKSVNRLGKAKKYDAIIAYSEGVPTAYVSHLNHKNKIAWIHCDYSSYMTINNNPDETEIYSKYNSIVCVSEYTKREFVKIMPKMEGITFSLHNLVNAAVIKKSAKEQITDTKFTAKSFSILSVGRVDIVKRFDKIPEIASKLRERGIDFVWYLIGPKGFGEAQIQFEENMKKFNVGEVFRWLGAKDNPYPYMANSDLLVMTSKSEACPYVLNEAKIIGLPIITTNYGSSIEFIDNGLDGIITPIEYMADEIEEIITNKEFYNAVKQHLQAFEYKNNTILNKFYSLIG